MYTINLFFTIQLFLINWSALEIFYPNREYEPRDSECKKCSTITAKWYKKVNLPIIDYHQLSSNYFDWTILFNEIIP